MIKYCEEVLQKSTIAINQLDMSKAVCVKILSAAVSDQRLSTYPSDATQDFIVAYKKAKELDSQLTDIKDRYETVLGLEKACETFFNTCQCADIKSVYVQDAEDIIIDKETKIVEVKFPENMSNYERDVEIIPCEGAVIARNITRLNFAKNNIVPVYCKALNKYVYWTIRKSDEHPTDTEEWLSASDEKELCTVLSDNEKYLRPTMQPIFYNRYVSSEEDFSIDFTKVNPNKYWDMTFIIAANDTNLKTDGLNYRSERFELTFTSDNKGYLYEIYNGKKVLQTTFNVSVSDKANNLKVKIEPLKNKTHIEISLNNQKIINTYSIRRIYGGYYGYYSQNTGLKIK